MPLTQAAKGENYSYFLLAQSRNCAEELERHSVWRELELMRWKHSYGTLWLLALFSSAGCVVSSNAERSSGEVDVEYGNVRSIEAAGSQPVTFSCITPSVSCTLNSPSGVGGTCICSGPDGILEGVAVRNEGKNGSR